MGWIEIILCVPAGIVAVGAFLFVCANDVHDIRSNAVSMKKGWPPTLPPREWREKK
jgi:hypothetical protein